LWFQFLHLWFWISLFVVSISSFVIFNIFNFFICGFSIFFSTDLPTFLSFFTLLSFWNLPYRLFQFYNSGTDIFMTLPCFFYRSTAFFRSPYQVGGSTLFSLIWANFKNVPPSQNVRAKGYEDCHGNTRRSN
jgi:hypothetical protein